MLAIAAGIGLAVVLGNGDAGNATGAMVATRAAPAPVAFTWNVAWHLAGGVLSGTAVAVTVAHLIRLPNADIPGVLAAGCVSSIVFVRVAAWRGMPVSASHGLFAGLAGAALVAGGTRGVDWGHWAGWKATGMLSVGVALAASPLIAIAVAAGLRTVLASIASRLPSRSAPGVKGGVWLAAAAVAFADGGNDGQKAMGVMAVAAAAGHHRAVTIGLTVRVVAAAALAAGTVLGARKVVRSVSRGLYRMDLVDGLAAEGTAAVVIVAASAIAAPLSTSVVVASGVLGTGASRRPGHVRWRLASEIVAAWLITVPVCAALGAAAEALGRAV